MSVSASAGAQDVASGDLWTGYRSTADILLPFAEIAENSAVRIEATYMRDTETSLGTLTSVLTAAAPEVTDPQVLDTDYRLMQIETCRRQGLAICPILSVGGSGSGFIDNGNRLYTCRHVVEDWPLAAALLNNVPMASIVPPLIVRNRQGDLLYNSAYSHNRVRFGTLNEDPRLAEELILKYRALAGRPLPKLSISYSTTLQYLLKASDFVAMQSDDDLIPPVHLTADANIAAGDVFYLSGYPSETDLLPKRYDGSPDKLLVSSVLTTTVYSPMLPLLMAQGLQRPGGSGGIVTNAAGAVIGMSCFADTSNAYAFAFDMEAQKQFWAELKTSNYTDIYADLPVESAARN